MLSKHTKLFGLVCAGFFVLAFFCVRETHAFLPMHTGLVAGVSVTNTAAVAPNPENSLLEQLNARSTTLDAREALLRQKEIQFQNTEAWQQGMLVFLFSACILFALAFGIHLYSDLKSSHVKSFHRTVHGN